MEKKDMRNYVQNAVKSFLEGQIKETILSNIILVFDPYDQFENANVYVKKMVYGKPALIETFSLDNYYKNFWEMVSEPWTCDLVTDITNLVEQHYEEPKRKGW